MNDLKELYERRIARITREMARRIDVTFGSNPFRPLTKRFAIATSARTGSYLLSERLLEHGVVVTEGFLPSRIIGACKHRGLAGLEDYCKQHLAENAVDGVFGVKGEFHILAPLSLAGELPHYLSDWRFVHLTRLDMLKQAISFVIAEETEAWRSFRTPVKALTESDFDGPRIATTLAWLKGLNSAWRDTFRLFGVDPLTITYEELAADPAGVTARVARYLELGGPSITEPRFLNPPLEVQATELNERWEARFREGTWGGV